MKSTYKIKKENLKLTTLGFTLIELIAVLVILAILALIVTPLVMNIIRKAKISADKRSIDAYGRSIELAIASYLLDTGRFPTQISDLTIEYSGSVVVCSTTQLNSDSSVYLSGCTVNGRSVDYEYGRDLTPPAAYTAYSIGDEVTYNGVDYRVIKDSGANESTVTLLKAEPLSTAEVNEYGGVGTANNYVNQYTYTSQGTANDNNGYGGMAYYSSETCGYINGSNVYTGCTIEYAQSKIKYVVDAWKNVKAPEATTARLITKQEIDENFEFEDYDLCGGNGCIIQRISESWMYNVGGYWIMTSYNNSSYIVWSMENTGYLTDRSVDNSGGEVRPVIVISKSLIN